MKPMISVVVVNYKADEEVHRWREQLAAEKDIECVVIDHSDGKKGYGAGLNEGVKQAKGEYVVCANPDVRMATEDIRALVSVLEQRSNVGVVGPQIVDENGQVQITCSLVPGPLVALIEYSFLGKIYPFSLARAAYRLWGFSHDTSRFVPSVSGSLFAVRQKDWVDLGGADEKLFLYFEEFDLALRYKQKRLGVYFLATAQAHHRGQLSTQQRSGVMTIFHASRRYWLEKWYGWRGLMVAKLLELGENKRL